MENEKALQKKPSEALHVANAMDTPSTLALAIEKGMDPATLAKLMDLQERWEANQAKKAFVDAMAGFKSECPAVIAKDRRADFGQGKAKYSYATTGAIVTAITPALSKFGLSLSWETRQHEKQITVVCHVTHSGGHRESAILTGPHDESGGKNPIQTIGSSVHYLQRYTMVSVLGLATADMDDPDVNPARPPVAMPTEKAKAPAAAPAPASAAEQTATGVIEKVTVKEGKKGDKPWTKYGVLMNAAWYGTFDRTMGEAAQALEGAEATITYKVDGAYNTLLSVNPAGAAQDDLPTEQTM